LVEHRSRQRDGRASVYDASERVHLLIGVAMFVIIGLALIGSHQQSWQE
jgi:hypothetical protein